MNLAVSLYKTIDEMDVALWERTIAAHQPLLSAQFMSLVEAIHPNDTFYYMVWKRPDGDVVALAFYYLSRFDLLQELSGNWLLGKIKSVWPHFMTMSIGMTATWETYGRHFWFDPQYLDYKAFSGLLLEVVKKSIAPHSIAVWRDYLRPDTDQEAQHQLLVNLEAGFVNAPSVSLSEIVLKEGLKEEAYFYEIKKKHRVYLRKILNEREMHQISLAFIEDYLPLVDDILYPLYQSVHANAKEYQTPILPKLFFTEIKEKFGSDAQVLALRDTDGKIVAFVLLVKYEHTLNPFLIGMDYSKRMYNLWYHCTWESIMYAIRAQLKYIDLGATNFQMKQKLGAQKIENHISLRFNNKVLNACFKKILVQFAK